MDIIHVLTVLEDQFSFSQVKKITSVSEVTYKQMRAGVGSIFTHFDKKAQIRYEYKVLVVRQATPEDYAQEDSIMSIIDNIKDLKNKY